MSDRHWCETIYLATSNLAAAAAEPNGGIFVPPDVTLSAFIEQTIAAVARHRLPSIYYDRGFVTNGGLVYYGADRVELFRGAAVYVDRILRGPRGSVICPISSRPSTNLLSISRPLNRSA